MSINKQMQRKQLMKQYKVFKKNYSKAKKHINGMNKHETKAVPVAVRKDGVVEVDDSKEAINTQTRFLGPVPTFQQWYMSIKNLKKNVVQKTRQDVVNEIESLDWED